MSSGFESVARDHELVDELVVDRYVLGSDYEILRGWMVHDLVVNGRSLAELWEQATERAALALPDRDMRRYSGSEEEPTANLAQNGTVPVITCACGDFLCGGATVRVTVGDEVVTWDDFRTANTRAPVDLGPFRFERRAYMAALASK
jgi:hypothetical protein